MTTFRVTGHAISRYRERVAPVTYDEALALLSTQAIKIAADFGAGIVRLGSGHRVVLVGQTVITVMPRDNFKRQIHRRGLGRYGKTWREEE